MTPAAEAVANSDAIGRVYAAAGLSGPPAFGEPTVPVPLARLTAGCNLRHAEVPGLTRGVADAYFQSQGIRCPEVRGDDKPLTGLLVAGRFSSWILVRAEDSLVRRRFTVAHALGHYLLQLVPRLQEMPAEDAWLVQADGDDTVCEYDHTPLAAVERQANHFAVELLMPEAVCRALRQGFLERMGPTARFLEHQLASVLLVSREAARARLWSLGLQGTSPTG
jgi:Zn-dependent peptidase ImmA (M78 family)